ncbi:paraquat-inducible protein A [Corallincola spongiicola]|uniref:Paraquat-inducible protein A n=1 Tax=Corallincola spongiicola TaxID=2520508 RepID=A0ABY1WR13_9GAMM|nr:paraquat-inducible protein A [Corallincola spongiicola]TAA47153.1 paraquat-inducible protein A [Corallincola spongiicola]
MSHSTKSLPEHGHLTACHECDLLVNLPHERVGYRLKCPCCGYVIVDTRYDALGKTLAASLAALLLFIPANLLPIMAINIGDMGQSTTVLQGAKLMWQAEYFWVAFMVVLTAFIVPLLELSLLLSITVLAKLRRGMGFVVSAVKVYQKIRSWGMLEVYMFGILVSIVKLVDLADLVVNGGLYCFGGLLFCSTYAAASFDPHEVWEIVDETKH